MSDDKVVKMPGVRNTDEPILTDAHLAVEEALVQDIGEVLEMYSGRISNVAMIGSLNLIATMVSLGSIGDKDE